MVDKTSKLCKNTKKREERKEGIHIDKGQCEAFAKKKA